jgi:hypothetical protein
LHGIPRWSRAKALAAGSVNTGADWLEYRKMFPMSIYMIFREDGVAGAWIWRIGVENEYQ